MLSRSLDYQTDDVGNITWNGTVFGNNTRNETDYTESLLLYHSLNHLELVLLFMFLLTWSVSIAYFCFRWNTVRLMQPVGTRYCYMQYMPKNIHTVSVVRNEEDSVIYCK